MEKTAMQIAIDLFSDESTPVHDISDVIDECRKLLELEKKQLIEASSRIMSIETAEQYYNIKFNK